jgi:hypothetical protein
MEYDNMINHHLQYAYDEKMKDNERLNSRRRGFYHKYDIYEDDKPFGIVFRDILYELLHWPFHAAEILYINNWRLVRLLNDDGLLRKPKVYLSLDVTSKDNLALDWYPAIPRPLSLENTDWVRWDNEWPIGGGPNLPFNRILFLHMFGFYCNEYRSKQRYDKAEQHLL